VCVFFFDCPTIIAYPASKVKRFVPEIRLAHSPGE
jgi:hypothetical protein